MEQLQHVITALQFLYPHALWLLLLLPLIIGFCLRKANDRVWQKIIDPQLAPFVLSGKRQQQAHKIAFWAALAWVLGVFALAGPSWEKRAVPVYKNPHALVIALDLSLSMLAQDVAPERLSRARFKLMDLLQQRTEGQTALIVFAGDAFAVAPLTDDTTTIIEQVKNLTPDIMPVQGSRVANALYLARNLFKQARVNEGDILLITDGANDVGQAKEAASSIAADGYRTSLLSVGTAEGAPIPLTNGGFLQDAQGSVVLPKVDQSALNSIAQAGQGMGLSMRLDDSDIADLQQQWQQYNAAKLAGEKQQITVEVNQGYWLLLPLLPLLLLVFRRGWLVLLVVITLPQPKPVWAMEWQDLWQTPDQQAAESMQQENYEKAQQLFQNPDWKAAAAYRAKDYNSAANLYANSNSIEGQYNYANALAQQNRLKEALDVYDKVLAQQADHEDARYNRRQVETLLAQQERQKQQQQGEGGKSGEGGEGGEGGDQRSSARSGSPSSTKNPSEIQSNRQNTGNANGNDMQQKQQASKAKPATESQTKPATDETMEQPMDAQEREKKQAAEQWLRRIPDDSSGLWRRKFLYQYRQRTPQQPPQAW